MKKDKTKLSQREKKLNKLSNSARKEFERLGKQAKDVFVETPDTPDDFKEYPKIVVCTTDPKTYAYPILLKLENHDIIRIEVMNKYISTALRIADLLKWCMDIRLKRKRVSEQIKTGKKIIVNEYVLQKIPACRK